MVKDAIKFLWACFYCLGKNAFLLQAIVSVANLFSPDVANIATKMKVNYCPLCIDWQAEEQTTIVRSVVELIETLDCSYDKLPPDGLDILVRTVQRIAYLLVYSIVTVLYTTVVTFNVHEHCYDSVNSASMSIIVPHFGLTYYCAN